MLDLYEDILNPLGYYQQQQPMQNKPKIPPLSLEEEQALLPKIAGSAMGGLGWAGSILEKPGRAVRGLMAGNPREALAWIPFSDTLGITDYNDRIDGRKLLRKAGLAGEEDTWGNFLAGLAIDIATDPTTYMTFGARALTDAGRVAQKIGRLPTTTRGRLGGSLAEILQADPGARTAAEIAAGGAGKLAALERESLGGLFGWAMPFQSASSNPQLVGKAGLDVLDSVGNFGRSAYGVHKTIQGMPGVNIPYSMVSWPIPLAEWAAPKIANVGRHLGALFDASVMDAVTTEGRAAAKEQFKKMNEFVGPYRERAFLYGQKLNQLGLDDADELRRLVEQPHHVQHINPEVNNIVMAMRNDMDNVLQEAQRLGLNIKEWGDPMDQLTRYFHRSASFPLKGGSWSKDPLSVLRAIDPRIQTGREDILEGFKEATAGINKMLADSSLYDPAIPQLVKQARIRNQYLTDLPAAMNSYYPAMPTNLTPQAAAAELLRRQNEMRDILAKRSERLLDWMSGLPEEFHVGAMSGQPIPLFGNNPIADYIKYFEHYSRMKAAAEATHNLIARNFQFGSAGPMPRDMVRATKALGKAGLIGETIPGQGGGILSGAHAELLDRINRQVAGYGGSPLADINDVFIDRNTANEIGRIMGSFQSTEPVNFFTRGVDWLTNLFKGYVTAVWPGFHVRNFGSGQYQTAAQSGLGAFKHIPGSYGMFGGNEYGELANLPMFAGRNVTAREATDEVARAAAAYGLAGHMPNISRDIVGPLGETITAPTSLDDVLSRIPGHHPKSLATVKDVLAGAKPDTSWNPTNVLNVSGVNSMRDVFVPMVAGRELGDVVENVNRMPMFIDLLSQGWSPAAAADEVLRTHFDYTKTALTGFEKSFMRRLMPFYSFTRQNIPLIMEQMVTNPGGAAGQMARFALNARQGEGFLPKYLGEGLAIPMGEQDPVTGNRRYLTRFDLPPEQAFEWYKGSTGDPFQAVLMGFLSQMNPILKGPLEYATGKQFFSGRELGDLYSITGSPILDQVIFNSPFARFATTGRMLADERKWETPYAPFVNLFTGIKITDVDIPKYQMIAEREAIKEALRGSPAVGKYETLTLKPEYAGMVSPEEYQMMRLQRLLEKKSREDIKAKKIVME